MKVNLDKVMVQLSGEPLLDEDGATPLTLGRVCAAALVNDTSGDGGAKDKRYGLAVRIFPGGEVELTTEEVVFVKDCIGRVVSSTVHAGQARVLLETASS